LFARKCIFVCLSNKVEINGQNDWEPISRGDKQVFEHVFKNHYALLCRYAKSFINDLDEAEEVVQNTFYIIWSKRETLEITGSLKAYLYRAVHNDCLNKLKHLQVRKVHANDYTHTNAGIFENTGEALLAKELRQKIEQAIGALPEQCAKVFRLSRFEELKYHEIAEQLNISVKTVENHMGKALKHMREHLKDYLPTLLWVVCCLKNWME
jgi:RNA polymerase sigma-70 factor (family 1)